MLGFAYAPLVVVVVLALNVFLPGRWVEGYVRDEGTGRRLRYHLNGLRVFFVSIGLWALACSSGLLAWDAFYVERWTMAASACVVGLVFSLVMVLPAPAVEGRSWLAEVYLGRLANPQWQKGRVDAKMFLYLVGATLLELNLLSFGAHHVLGHPDDSSPGVFLYGGLFTFFLVEYLFFEEVHLYTYDFVAERVGFKLGWGCLVFYPFFYGIGLWTQAEKPNPHSSPLWLALCGLGFFSGWALSRGANLQKFAFKRDPTKKFLGLAPQVLSDGQKLVLASGFWGLARHINYLGELMMASALTLSLGFPTSWEPWLYPLYYLALLVPRQHDDDRRCAAKYGPLWAEYVKRVPYRIIPFVF